MNGTSNMSYEIVLNNKDTSCPHCGRELPKGVDVIIDKREPQAGTFCAEWEGIEAYCWEKYFKVELEDDPYKEVERENMAAIISENRNRMDRDDF